MKISDAKTLIASAMQYNIDQYAAGKGHNTFVVPMLIGDPGVGKTAAPRQVAREAELPYHQCIIAQYDAGEMAGLPFKSTATITAPDTFESEEEAQLHAVTHHLHNPRIAETGKNEWQISHEVDRMVRLRPSYLPDDPICLFNLDELPQAFLANQNIASQIVNEYRVGEHEMSLGTTIVGTGNRPENKAGTTTMPTHLKDRLTFIPIEPNLDDFLAYAAAYSVDTRVRAYLRQNPARLHDFKVGTTANPTPRSWEKVSAWLSMGLPKHIRTQALSGQIGEGDAIQFETWLRVEDKMPKLEDILKDPKNAPQFTNKQADILYLLLANLADIANDSNIQPILEYIKLLPNQEFAAFWAQDCFSRNKELLKNKHVVAWKVSHAAKIL